MKKKLLFSTLTFIFSVGVLFAQTAFACSDWFISPQKKCPKSLIKVD